MRDTSAGAWYGDPELKAAIVAELEQDLALDRYRRGLWMQLDIADDPDDIRYGSHWHGCHLGCLVLADMHREGKWQPSPTLIPDSVADHVGFDRASWVDEAVERFNFPGNLLLWQEYLFENMMPSYGPSFAVESVRAIEPGADLTSVGTRWVLAMLQNSDNFLALDCGGWFGELLASEGGQARVEILTGIYVRAVAGEIPRSSIGPLYDEACAGLDDWSGPDTFLNALIDGQLKTAMRFMYYEELTLAAPLLIEATRTSPPAVSK
jgi:hypothetical protein